MLVALDNPYEATRIENGGIMIAHACDGVLAPASSHGDVNVKNDWALSVRINKLSRYQFAAVQHFYRLVDYFFTR